MARGTTKAKPFRRPKQIPVNKLTPPEPILDSLVDPETHPYYAPHPDLNRPDLENRPARFAVSIMDQVPDRTPLTVLNPDEPPPDYDPQYFTAEDGIPQHVLKERGEMALYDQRENKKYYNALIEAMGEEMESLISALSVSEDSKARSFMTALLSTKYKNWSITRLASRFGINPGDLSKIWRDYNLSRAMLNVTSALPSITHRMVKDSLSGHQVCPNCEGRTTVRIEIQVRTEDDEDLMEDQPHYKVIVCPNCKGHGTITKPGHEHSRDRLLEMAGLTRKGGGTIVNTTINMPQVESLIEELDKAKALPAMYSNVTDNDAGPKSK